jgi:putative tricarboxylic transport membrane protein
VRLLRVPYYILFPLILLFCLIGVYSVNNTVVDIYITILFGIVGYLMQKFGFEAAPLALAFVLGPMLETALRESLQMSGGSFSILFTRPISGSCMILVAALLILQISSAFRSKKKGGTPET